MFYVLCYKLYLQLYLGKMKNVIRNAARRDMICNQLLSNPGVNKQYRSSGRKTIAKIEFGALLNFNIIIPEAQRIVDHQVVKEIVQYQDNYYKNSRLGEFNFLGVISVHCCAADKRNYLVDGQHRYAAVDQLYHKLNYSRGEKKCYIDVVILNALTLDEVRSDFNLINRNTTMPDIPIGVPRRVPDEVANYFYNMYSEAFKRGKRPKRPFVNKNQFIEALGYLTKALSKIYGHDTTVEELKETVRTKNEEMSRWPAKSYTSNVRYGVRVKGWISHKSDADAMKFYLGMYKATNSEYTYQWVADIIKSKGNRDVEKECRKRRRLNKHGKQKVPQVLREKMFDEYTGRDARRFKCFCCRIQDITVLSAECGHVIAEARGGTMTIENLRPICSKCNKQMSTKFMTTYMSKYFPHNLKYIDGRSTQFNAVRCVEVFKHNMVVEIQESEAAAELLNIKRARTSQVVVQNTTDIILPPAFPKAMFKLSNAKHAQTSQSVIQNTTNNNSSPPIFLKAAVKLFNMKCDQTPRPVIQDTTNMISPPIYTKKRLLSRWIWNNLNCYSLWLKIQQRIIFHHLHLVQ